MPSLAKSGDVLARFGDELIGEKIAVAGYDAESLAFMFLTLFITGKFVGSKEQLCGRQCKRIF